MLEPLSNAELYFLICLLVAGTMGVGVFMGWQLAKQPKERKLDEFVIKKSAIHGLGCFSTKRYEKGDYVGFYGGRIAWGRAEDDPYFLVLGEEKYDGDEVEWGVIGDGPLMYVNHSEDANLDCGDGPFLYAARLIKRGEELTLDYDGEDEDGPVPDPGKADPAPEA